MSPAALRTILILAFQSVFHPLVVWGQCRPALLAEAARAELDGYASGTIEGTDAATTRYCSQDPTAGRMLCLQLIDDRCGWLRPRQLWLADPETHNAAPLAIVDGSLQAGGLEELLQTRC